VIWWTVITFNAPQRQLLQYTMQSSALEKRGVFKELQRYVCATPDKRNQ
jgi:hypothetical protein